jgi:hypothetical protein
MRTCLNKEPLVRTGKTLRGSKLEHHALCAPKQIEARNCKLTATHSVRYTFGIPAVYFYSQLKGWTLFCLGIPFERAQSLRMRKLGNRTARYLVITHKRRTFITNLLVLRDFYLGKCMKVITLALCASLAWAGWRSVRLIDAASKPTVTQEDLRLSKLLTSAKRLSSYSFCCCTGADGLF